MGRKPLQVLTRLFRLLIPPGVRKDVGNYCLLLKSRVVNALCARGTPLASLCYLVLKTAAAGVALRGSTMWGTHWDVTRTFLTPSWQLQEEQLVLQLLSVLAEMPGQAPESPAVSARSGPELL